MAEKSERPGGRSRWWLWPVVVLAALLGLSLLGGSPPGPTEEVGGLREVTGAVLSGLRSGAPTIVDQTSAVVAPTAASTGSIGLRVYPQDRIYSVETHEDLGTAGELGLVGEYVVSALDVYPNVSPPRALIRGSSFGPFWVSWGDEGGLGGEGAVGAETGSGQGAPSSGLMLRSPGTSPLWDQLALVIPWLVLAIGAYLLRTFLGKPTPGGNLPEIELKWGGDPNTRIGSGSTSRLTVGLTLRRDTGLGITDSISVGRKDALPQLRMPIEAAATSLALDLPPWESHQVERLINDAGRILQGRRVSNPAANELVQELQSVADDVGFGITRLYATSLDDDASAQQATALWNARDQAELVGETLAGMNRGYGGDASIDQTARAYRDMKEADAAGTREGTMSEVTADATSILNDLAGKVGEALTRGGLGGFLRRGGG